MNINYTFDFLPTDEEVCDYFYNELGMDDYIIENLSDEEFLDYYNRLIFETQLEAMEGFHKIELKPYERLVYKKCKLNENDEPGEVDKFVVFRRGNMDQIFRVFDTFIPQDKISYQLFINENEDLIANIKHTLLPDSSYIFRISTEEECFADVLDDEDPYFYIDNESRDYFDNAIPAGKRILEYIHPTTEIDLGQLIREFGRQ